MTSYKRFWRLAVPPLFVAAVSMASPPARISFVARKDSLIAGAAGPSAMAIADFNRDGRQDIAVLGVNTNIVEVLLSNGDGTFRAGAQTNVGLQPLSIGAGDFNRDGNPDLAIATLTGLAILLGNGDGTFQPLLNERGAFGNALAVGDFNGDGRLDVIVAYTQSSQLTLLAGNGDGTFQAAQHVAALPNAVFLATGDFNSDGKRDIAMATGTNGQVAVLLGHGDGTFGAPQVVSAPGAVWLAIGDFNGDGKPDIASADFFESSGKVSILLGNGDGTLQSARTIVSGGEQTLSITAADFNGDGHLDLAVTNGSIVPPPNAAVLLGNGDGTFQKAATWPMGGSIAIAAADFNGDHRADLAVSNHGLNVNTVSTLIGNGDGTFQAAPQFVAGDFPAGGTLQGIAEGDFNSDGQTDFAIADTGAVLVLTGAGGGKFHIGQFVNVDVADTYGQDSIVTGDFNGDGKLDLVVATGTTSVSVFPGNGDATFQAAVSSSVGIGQGAVATGDFNGDGRLDVALTLHDPTKDSGTSLSAVAVMLGNGDGTFGKPQFFAAGLNPISISVADLNKDGKLDLVVVNLGNTAASGPGSVSILLGNGDGTFQPQAPRLTTGYFPLQAAIADFDGDGNPDIVVVNDGETFLSVFPGNGDGTFGAAQRVFCGNGGQSLSIADFNGDGIQDLALVIVNEQDIAVLAGRGDGTFAPPQFFGAGNTPKLVAPRNGDLLVVNGLQNQPSAAASLLVNNTK